MKKILHPSLAAAFAGALAATVGTSPAHAQGLLPPRATERVVPRHWYQDYLNSRNTPAAAAEAPTPPREKIRKSFDPFKDLLRLIHKIVPTWENVRAVGAYARKHPVRASILTGVFGWISGFVSLSEYAAYRIGDLIGRSLGIRGSGAVFLRRKPNGKDKPISKRAAPRRGLPGARHPLPERKPVRPSELVRAPIEPLEIRGPEDNVVDFKGGGKAATTKRLASNGLLSTELPITPQDLDEAARLRVMAAALRTDGNPSTP